MRTKSVNKAKSAGRGKKKPITKTGLLCPRCFSNNLIVVDSRATISSKYRRRLCLDCNHKHTTYEIQAEVLNNIQNTINLIKQMKTLFDSADIRIEDINLKIRRPKK